MGMGEEQTARVSVRRPGVIAVTSSLRGPLSLFLRSPKGVADAGRWGELAEAAVFSIIPEAIVRAASERLTVAS